MQPEPAERVQRVVDGMPPAFLNRDQNLQSKFRESLKKAEGLLGTLPANRSHSKRKSLAPVRPELAQQVWGVVDERHSRSEPTYA